MGDFPLLPLLNSGGLVAMSGILFWLVHYLLRQIKLKDGKQARITQRLLTMLLIKQGCTPEEVAHLYKDQDNDDG